MPNWFDLVHGDRGGLRSIKRVKSLTDLSSYKNARGLVETTDPEHDDKPLFRRPGFDGIRTFGEMDEIIAAFLKQIREEHGLPRAEFAPLVGLSVPVYGRCERAFSRMTVTRMIHRFHAD